MDIPFPRPESEVKNIFFLAYTITGEAFEIEGKRWEAVPEDWELGKRMDGLAEELIWEGMVKAHPARIMEGGMEGILGGMQMLKEKKVSGVKLVYRVGQV
jgi:hypothetical protein